MLITKAELSRELHIARSGVSKLIGRGMPVLPDGRVDLLRACKWIAANNQNGGQVLWHALEWVRLLDKPPRLRL
jgi:hypothetical protein